MRSGSNFIIAFACVSFLTITMSGFHLHADIGGHDEADVGVHDDHESHERGLHDEYESHAHGLHPVLLHDLDDDHIDVFVFEPASGFSKAQVFIPYFAVPELAALPPLEKHWPADTPSLAPRRDLRWQPPPRASPFSA